LAKHSKHFSLEDALSVGVDRMQTNFDPIRQQVERWRAQQLSVGKQKRPRLANSLDGLQNKISATKGSIIELSQTYGTLT
jgi:hypothetical protein